MTHLTWEGYSLPAFILRATSYFSENKLKVMAASHFMSEIQGQDWLYMINKDWLIVNAKQTVIPCHKSIVLVQPSQMQHSISLEADWKYMIKPWTSPPNNLFLTTLSLSPHTDPLAMSHTAGLILGLRPANERCRYKVTPSLIGWEQT